MNMQFYIDSCRKLKINVFIHFTWVRTADTFIGLLNREFCSLGNIFAKHFWTDNQPKCTHFVWKFSWSPTKPKGNYFCKQWFVVKHINNNNGHLYCAGIRQVWCSWRMNIITPVIGPVISFLEPSQLHWTSCFALIKNVVLSSVVKEIIVYFDFVKFYFANEKVFVSVCFYWLLLLEKT